MTNSRRAETTDIVLLYLLLTVLVDQTNTPGGGQENERYNTSQKHHFPRKAANCLLTYALVQCSLKFIVAYLIE